MLLVFDLDGTLIDSMRDLAEAASETVMAFGGTPLDVDTVTRMVGDGAAALVKRALDASGAAVSVDVGLARFLELYDQQLLVHTRPYDGIPEALEALRAYPMAVLTNKPLAPSTTILEGLGLLSRFERVIGGDGPYPRKPDPSSLLALSAAHPDEPLVLVGDSPVDERTAAAAGCRFVLARYGFGWARYASTRPETPLVIEHPSELPSVIARIAAAAR